MDRKELHTLQSPLKKEYLKFPQKALITLEAEGKIGDDVTCQIITGKSPVKAGLHPATGGKEGAAACSGDMLLEALAACAGVTMGAVATSMKIHIRSGTVLAEGDIDFRGTLGVSREAPVGFKNIRLHFDLDTDAPNDKIAKLVELTERYCVVFQTLNRKPDFEISYEIKNSPSLTG